MKCLICFLFIFQFAFSQNIESKKYGFVIDSASNAKEIIQFMDENVHQIEIVKLLPTSGKSSTRVDETTQILEIDKQCCFNTIIHDDEINQKKIGVRKMLSHDDVRIVFQALYIASGEKLKAYCYEPRHGLCFYNEKGKLLGFVEICLKCYQTETTSGIPEFPSHGEENFDMLRKLIRKYDMLDLEE